MVFFHAVTYTLASDNMVKHSPKYSGGFTGGPIIGNARLSELRTVNAIPRFPDLGPPREKVERRSNTQGGYL